MCIVCKNSKSLWFEFTSKFYNPYKNKKILNVSFCDLITSEKLQEVLIQCKNLETLLCYNCTSLTSLDLRSNINLKTLWCDNCSSLTSLDLRSSSEGITSFGCINLTTLRCVNCTSLTSLDLRSNINLKTLWCDNCTSLISLDLRNNSEGVTSFGCINLATLGCNSCTSLTSLDLRNNIKLTILRCDNCISLTSLDLPKEYNGYIDCSNCPWITQNKDFSNNYQNLIKLQRWYRKLVIIKYMKSQEFIEWFYNPNNIGGKCHKKSLLNSF